MDEERKKELAREGNMLIEVLLLGCSGALDYIEEKKPDGWELEAEFLKKAILAWLRFEQKVNPKRLEHRLREIEREAE